MKSILSIFIIFLFMADANAFVFSKREKEKQKALEAEKSQQCVKKAIDFTYASIQAKYDHWEYNPKDFTSNFSYIDPDDGLYKIHVKEKHYRFEHKIFLDNETCEIIGYESFAF